MDEARDPHAAGSRPRPVGAAVAARVDQVAERALPAGAQRAHGQQPAHRRHVRAGQVELGVGDGDADPLGRRADLDDVVARPHAALPQDPEVEAGPVVGHEQRGHPRLAQAQPDAVAGDARLRDLELGLADAVAVADAHLVVGQPVDGEVLAEDPPAQVGAVQVLTPVLVGLGLVDHDRALLAAVSAQVALPVAVEVQPARHHRSGNRLFPDAGVHRLPVPRDVAWQADVHGQEHGHAAMMPAARSASHPSDTLGDASRRETRGCDGRDPRATVGSLPQQPAQDRQRRRSACAPTSFPVASSPTTRSRTTPGSCAR